MGITAPTVGGAGRQLALFAVVWDWAPVLFPSYGRQWFAVQVKPRCEKICALSLRQKGYEEFLPLYKRMRQWSDRSKQIELPLFPGYIFCRMDPAIGARIVTTPGVIRIVGFGKNPVSIPDDEIATIKTVDSSGLSRHPWPSLHSGQRVRINEGPLCGIEGTFVSCKNHNRLVLSVPLLQQAIAVEVERGWVVPVIAPATERFEPRTVQ